THSPAPSSASDAASVSARPTYNPNHGLRVLPLIVFMTPPDGTPESRSATGKRRQVTYLSSNVTPTASCLPLASAASVAARQRPAGGVRQHARLAGLDVQQRALRAAPQQPEMLWPSELPPVQRQPADIARLGSADDQQAVARQCIGGEPHGAAAERL